jgi:hypothetical protein
MFRKADLEDLELIQLVDLEAGMYIVKVQSGSKAQQFKIIKQ